MISYFLICKLFPEVSSGTDRLNLMTIKVIKREQIDVLKAQICSQFAKSNVGKKNKKKTFINGVSCWSVKHIFLRWQNKEKWHLYICVSQFPTLVKKKCRDRRIKNLISQKHKWRNLQQWLGHNLSKWNHHWIHVFVLFQCQCTWPLTKPLSPPPLLVFFAPFWSHYFGFYALIYTMRTKSWWLSSAANACLPVILTKVPGFLTAHKSAHNAFMQGLRRNAQRRQQTFFFSFLIPSHQIPLFLWKTGTSWSESQDKEMLECKGHKR